METANTQKEHATLKRKTQCYIIVLLNREANRLQMGISKMINGLLTSDEELDAEELRSALGDYRKARDERDAFCRWINEQGAEE